MSDLSGRTAVVVGASRGLGRGIAVALAEAGARVVALSRSGGERPETAGPEPIVVHAADATDPAVAAELLLRHDPDIVVLVAGARPRMVPLQEHTWETFSSAWDTDVRIAFHWLREALVRPLRPGSRVVVVSSAASMNGSPLSGGYAGAKGTQRFIAGYAQDEADRGGLDLTFSVLLPRVTPATGLGRPAIRAYADRAGVSEQEYRDRLSPLVTPESIGAAVVGLVLGDQAAAVGAHLLTGAGPTRLP